MMGVLCDVPSLGSPFLIFACEGQYNRRTATYSCYKYDLGRGILRTASRRPRRQSGSR